MHACIYSLVHCAGGVLPAMKHTDVCNGTSQQVFVQKTCLMHQCRQQCARHMSNCAVWHDCYHNTVGCSENIEVIFQQGQRGSILQDAERAEAESLDGSSGDESAPTYSPSTPFARRNAPAPLTLTGTAARKGVTPLALPRQLQEESVDREKPKQRIYKNSERHVLVGLMLAIA